jgi:hypothetical protein
MKYRVQRRDPDTKRWNTLCDLKDRDLAEIALRRWRAYLFEHGRIEDLRIVEMAQQQAETRLGDAVSEGDKS